MRLPPRILTELVRTPIDSAALQRSVGAPGVGAIVCFVGVVRAETNAAGASLVALDYSAHESMANAELERMARDCATRFDVSAVVAVHRLGRLAIGDASIAVVVGAAHRAASFDCSRELMERIKADLPVFKREIWSDGAGTWVNPI